MAATSIDAAACSAVHLPEGCERPRARGNHDARDRNACRGRLDKVVSEAFGGLRWAEGAARARRCQAVQAIAAVLLAAVPAAVVFLLLVGSTRGFDH
jgi:hypothetical protein